MDPLYLDNHTTTRPSKKAVSAALPYWQEKWGTPAAPHTMGNDLEKALKEGYQGIYDLLGARSSDKVFFTSSGAEAVNQVIMSTYFNDDTKRHFLTTTTDEAPVILTYERLQELGCDTELVDVNKMADHITPRTALISLSWANGMTGVIQPVQEIAELCRERGILLHLEASHVLGKIAFDLDEIAPDFISFNGDHIHAPPGTGALWVRSGLNPSPLILGRAGHVPAALVMALGTAAREALEMRDHVAIETARLRNMLEEGLNGDVLFKERERIPTTTCINFPGVTSDALLYRMQRKGIYASFGGGLFQQLSLQLETYGIKSHSAISLSLSRESTQEEVERAIREINAIVENLRTLSEAL